MVVKLMMLIATFLSALGLCIKSTQRQPTQLRDTAGAWGSEQVGELLHDSAQEDGLFLSGSLRLRASHKFMYGEA